VSTTVKRILVPLDLSPLGEVKLPIAEAQARAFGAELILLHVLPREAMADDGTVSPDEARARTYLDTVVSHMHADGVGANALVRTGAPAQTIVDAAREQQADLIVLGSSVRAGLPRAFLGSVADEVVRTAHCPVLLVRPQLEAGAGTPVRSFDEDAARAGPLAKRNLGIRTVEVPRIVGSVGRAQELAENFRPLKRTREDDQRYHRVLGAVQEGKGLPPVELYKLGFGYYVLDGNHRVAAARETGQVEIDADVVEFVPLGDLEAQRAFAERRAFERATGLTRIEAAHPGSYHRLQQIVEEYVASSDIPDRRDAARRWYGETYRPLVRRIRQLGLVRRFPGDRSADIFVRLADFRAGQAGEGEPLDWPAALERFAEAHAAPGGGPGDRPRRRTLPLMPRRAD
jgi:nucleotide-binding universal stress UspA family protein